MDTPNTPTKPTANSSHALNAYRILVINSKGDTGKTTVSTNLAAWLAYRDEVTVLMDADDSQASNTWVQQRSSLLPPVHGFKIDNQFKKKLTAELNVPKSTQWIITDAPEGITGQALDDVINEHDLILIPVMPSDMEIRTTARFIGELLLTLVMRRQRRPIAVVANRVKQQSDSWERLQKFLNSLDIPYPATLRDTQNYVRAYREGQGVVDYQQQAYLRDRADWEMLIQWIDAQHAEHQQRGTEVAEAILKEK